MMEIAQAVDAGYEQVFILPDDNINGKQMRRVYNIAGR